MSLRKSIQGVLPKNSAGYKVAKKAYHLGKNNLLTNRLQANAEISVWEEAGRQLPAPAPLKHRYLE